MLAVRTPKWYDGKEIPFPDEKKEDPMPYDLTHPLVIGISSRALFNLEEENRIFIACGLFQFTVQINTLQPHRLQSAVFPFCKLV